MSWNASYSSLESFRNDDVQAEGNLSAEGAEQWAVARLVASELIASGKVGGEGKDFRIHLSGHANPSHEPAKGWANDTITVTVSQK